jgi:hypothetical protein
VVLVVLTHSFAFLFHLILMRLGRLGRPVSLCGGSGSQGRLAVGTHRGLIVEGVDGDVSEKRECHIDSV